jgi:insulysin
MILSFLSLLPFYQYPGADTCSDLSSSMHMYKDHPDHYLSGSYKYYEYDPVAVAEIGTALRSRSSNVLVMLGSAEFEATATETDRWYGTKYRTVTTTTTESGGHPIIDLLLSTQPSEASASVNDSSSPTTATTDKDDLFAGMTLPARNDMLPDNFDLLCDRADCADLDETRLWKNDPEAPPRCLVNEPSLVLWYKADFLFKTPKVSVTALLRCPFFAGGPRVAVMAALWAEIATELCNDFAYNAAMAGLHCQFSDSVRGVQISIGGYNDKAGTLLKLMCDKICSPVIEEAFFERLRKKLEQSIQMALVSSPYQHGGMAANLVLESINKGFLQEQLEFLTNERLLGVDDMKHFSKALLSQSRIEMFVHGNVNAEEAKSLSKIVMDSLRPEIMEPLPVLRAIELPPSSLYRLEGWNDHDENSCVVVLFQIGVIDLRLNAVLSLLGQLVREQAFNVLRTEEQLGYIVFSSVKTSSDNVKSMQFLVQSDGFTPKHVDGRIEAFLQVFRNQVLADMSVEDFQDNVNSLCEGLLEKPKNLSEESHRHWELITNQSYHFSRLQDIAALIRTLTLEDVMQFFDRYILASSPHRRKLSVHMYGKAHMEELQAVEQADDQDQGDHGIIVCPNEFGRKRPLFAAQEVAPLEPHLFQKLPKM